MSPTIDIGVEIAWTSNISSEILRGVREFALTRPEWILRHIDSFAPDDSPSQHWLPAAGIYAGGPSAFNGKFKQMKGPIVAIGGASSQADLNIDLDNGPIGTLALQHFIDRGFRNFGFIGNGEFYAGKRCESFLAALEQKKLSCSVCPTPLARMNANTDRAVTAWLQGLPKPVGVLCSNDPVARDVLNVCHAAEFKVPDEIAIMGIDNDLVWCEASTPQLSSVTIPWRRFGWEAAQSVDRLLKNPKSKGERTVFIAPGDVMTRQSTDSVAVADAELARALAYVRGHACEGLSVKELVHATVIDRRALERKFVQHLGRSPHDEIRRVRIDRAKLLLRETVLSPDQIATQTGFSKKHFAAVFTQVVGVSPLKFRQRER